MGLAVSVGTAQISGFMGIVISTVTVLGFSLIAYYLVMMAVFNHKESEDKSDITNSVSDKIIHADNYTQLDYSPLLITDSNKETLKEQLQRIFIAPIKGSMHPHKMKLVKRFCDTNGFHIDIAPKYEEIESRLSDYLKATRQDLRKTYVEITGTYRGYECSLSYNVILGYSMNRNRSLVQQSVCKIILNDSNMQFTDEVNEKLVLASMKLANNDSYTEITPNGIYLVMPHGFPMDKNNMLNLFRGMDDVIDTLS